MSGAKLQVMEMLEQISDSVTDELQVVDDLYKLLKLQRSRQAVQRHETMTTAEVRDFFAARRSGMEAK